MICLVQIRETYKDKDGKTQDPTFGIPYDFDVDDPNAHGLNPVVVSEMRRTMPDVVKAGKTAVGNFGGTYLPVNAPNILKRSTNNHIQVIINSNGTLNHRAIGVSHEFGHVVLFMRHLPSGHGQEGVDDFIYIKRENVVKRRLGYDY